MLVSRRAPDLNREPLRADHRADLRLDGAAFAEDGGEPRRVGHSLRSGVGRGAARSGSPALRQIGPREGARPAVRGVRGPH